MLEAFFVAQKKHFKVHKLQNEKNLFGFPSLTCAGKFRLPFVSGINVQGGPMINNNAGRLVCHYFYGAYL